MNQPDTSRKLPNSSRIFASVHAYGAWQALLGDPEKHWMEGRSAKMLAERWMSASGFPEEVAELLGCKNGFPGIELLFGIPEHEVGMPARGRPSQNDLWCLARSGHDLVSIAVEGKVSESFGPTVEDWLKDASQNKLNRLSGLRGELDLGPETGNSIRYQLLHRTLSALREAGRFGAKHAVMLVHSFSPENAGFEDYEAFLASQELEAQVGGLSAPRKLEAISLRYGWVQGA